MFSFFLCSGYYPPAHPAGQYSGAAPYTSGYGGGGVPSAGGYGGGVPTSQQQVAPGMQNQQMVGASYGQQQEQSAGYPTSATSYTADAYGGQQSGYSYGGGHAQPAATYQQPYGGNAQPGPQK